MLKTGNKEEIFKAARGKKVTHYIPGKNVKIVANFSLNRMQVRREQNNIFKLLKERKSKIRVAYPVKMFLKRTKHSKIFQIFAS